MEKPEGAITAGVMELLGTVPFSEVVKIKGGSAQESGLPDVLFTCRAPGGRAVWIEVKAPGEKPRKLQAYKLERWKRAGAISLVVHSVDELEVILGHLHVLPVEAPIPVVWKRGTPDDWEHFYQDDPAGRRMRGEEVA